MKRTIFKMQHWILIILIIVILDICNVSATATATTNFTSDPPSVKTRGIIGWITSEFTSLVKNISSQFPHLNPSQTKDIAQQIKNASSNSSKITEILNNAQVAEAKAAKTESPSGKLNFSRDTRPPDFSFPDIKITGITQQVQLNLSDNKIDVDSTPKKNWILQAQLSNFKDTNNHLLDATLALMDKSSTTLATLTTDGKAVPLMTSQSYKKGGIYIPKAVLNIEPITYSGTYSAIITYRLINGVG
ncbi:MAG TPA: hypothetical protein H9875_07830 [Candidatus Levilactobacillus faecigallinarum]|uniref:WxL domain-containing protein n=1 Tax=Candidatus Levilactobacillus faecigallinarum TaxID=2838638 RepID=A0A9D1QTI0_9LACO|nr:hypothetical protein [Candidatus Levilactobacillus faecigallinarum]